MIWNNHNARWTVQHHVYGLRLRMLMLFLIIGNPLEFNYRILVGFVAFMALMQYWNAEHCKNKRDEMLELRENLSWERASQLWMRVRGKQSLLRKLAVVSTYLEMPVGKLRPGDTLGDVGNPCIASVNLAGQPIENLCLRVLDAKPGKAGFLNDRNRKTLRQGLKSLEDIVGYLAIFDRTSRWYQDTPRFRRRCSLVGDSILRIWDIGELRVHPIAVLRSLCLVAGDLGVDPRKLRPTDKLERSSNDVRRFFRAEEGVQIVRYRIAECSRIEPQDAELTTLGEVVTHIAMHWHQVEPRVAKYRGHPNKNESTEL